MVNEQDLIAVLTKHFENSFPEDGQDYTSLLPDICGMKINNASTLDNIIELHFPDAYLQDDREIQALKLPVGSSKTIEEIRKAPKIIRIVRKCFEHHFGIDWMVYRSDKLSIPLSRILRTLNSYQLQYVDPPVSNADLPSELFKYVTADTATSILRAGKFRLNSPLNFNDIKDIQIDPKLPQREEELIKIIQDRREQVIFNEEEVPGDKSNINYMLNSMVRAIRAPTTAPESFRARHDESDKKIAATIRINHQNIIKLWKHFVQYFRVLCLSDIKNDPRMWGTYSQQHQGVMLTFNPTLLVEPLSRWAKVEYLSEPPQPIDGLDVIDDILGIRKLETMKRVSRLCFVKHTSWSPESEWRCVLLRSDWEHHPLRSTAKNELYDDVPFSKESLTAVHIGVNCPHENKDKIISLLQEHYPATKIFIEEASSSSFEPIFKLGA
jgi:hypothetical protein